MFISLPKDMISAARKGGRGGRGRARAAAARGPGSRVHNQQVRA